MCAEARFAASIITTIPSEFGKGTNNKYTYSSDRLFVKG
jgi:hypothetical protein